MTTSIGQYAPVFLPGEPPPPWQMPGSPQFTGQQRAAHDWSDPVGVDVRLFLPMAALPQGELSMKVAQLLGLQGPWQCQVCKDTDCLHCRSYVPIRVFFWASCSWRSKGLSVAPPVQALRGLPCLGSFYVVWCVRHIEGPSWLGSYCIGWHLRHLKWHPRWGPTL